MGRRYKTPPKERDITLAINGDMDVALRILKHYEKDILGAVWGAARKRQMWISWMDAEDIAQEAQLHLLDAIMKFK